MVVIQCDTLFTVTGTDYAGAVSPADDPSGGDDLHYTCFYDLNYLFRGLVLCIDQDAGTAGNVALAADQAAVEPTVAYLRAQTNTTTAYSSALSSVDTAVDGGGAGGKFVCLPDGVNGYDHTVNQLNNLLYDAVGFNATSTAAEATATLTNVLGFNHTDNTQGFSSGAAKASEDVTSITLGSGTFATGITAVTSDGPIQYRGPMNATSQVLVVCDEDFGTTDAILTLGSMMYVDAGLLAFTNNPNTNDILAENGRTAHSTASGLANTDTGSLVYKMINDDRGLIALTDTSVADAAASRDAAKTIAGVEVATAVAEAGSGPMLEKVVGAVAKDTTGYASTEQRSCMFGRIMYDLIAGNAGRSIQAGPRVGARNYISDAEAAGLTVNSADAIALGVGGETGIGADAVALYAQADAKSEKKPYLACKWLSGDSLKLTWEIDYSSNILAVSSSDTNNALFNPSYLTRNTSSANHANQTGTSTTPGFVTVGLTITHVDLCGDSQTGYEDEYDSFIGN